MIACSLTISGATQTPGSNTPQVQTPVTVTNLNDSGPGSLRDAIVAANSTPGAEEISFAISGTIHLNSPLPILTDDSTIIRGSSAPDGRHSVALDGSALSIGHGLEIRSAANRIAGLTISGFPGNGITVIDLTSVHNTLTDNLIYDNGLLGIDLGGDGIGVVYPSGSTVGPNDRLAFPIIDSVVMRHDGAFSVFGSGAPGGTVEFFIAHPAGDPAKVADPSGHGEAYEQVGATATDDSGHFVYDVPGTVKSFSTLTATITDTVGNTSEFSADFSIVPEPMIVVANGSVHIIITDPLGRQFGEDAFGQPITEIPQAAYFNDPNDSVVIYHPILGDYNIGFVSEPGTPEGAVFSSIIRIDGTQQLVLGKDQPAPGQGAIASFPYTVEEGYHYRNGDANRDSKLNVADIIYAINYIFKAGMPPFPTDAADADCDSKVNVCDVVIMINYVFKGGPAPCDLTP